MKSSFKGIALAAMVAVTGLYLAPMAWAGGTAESTPVGNLAANGGVEGRDGKDFLRLWSKRGTSALTAVKAPVHGGANALLIAGRSAKGDGAAYSATNLLKPGKSYYISIWATLATESGEHRLYLQVDRKDDSGKQTVPIIGEATVRPGEWAKLAGIYSTSEADQFLSQTIAVAGKDDYIGDVIIDDLSVVETNDATPDAKGKPISDLPSSPRERTISSGWINYLEDHQTIEGFGVASAWCAGDVYLKTEIMDRLFSLDKGIGLTILRSMVAPEHKYSKNAAMDWSVDTAQFWMVREAAKRGDVKFMSSVWSPPGWMKSNNSSIGGKLKTECYQDFADYLSIYARGFRERTGQDLYAISMANEPDFLPSYDGCLWTGPEIRDFIKGNVKPTFARDGITARFIAAEDMNFNESLVVDTLRDPEAASRLDIVGVHGYSSGFSRLKLSEEAGKSLWMTEVLGYWQTDSGIRDGLVWAKRLAQHLSVANINAWNYWYAASSGDGNGGLIRLGQGRSGYLLPKRYWAVGSYSKFVRPGYVRLGATMSPAPDIFVTAFRDPAKHQLVVVAVNTNLNDQTVTLNLNGFAPTAIRAWRTSAIEDLADQGTLPVTPGALNAALPARSFTTYVIEGTEVAGLSRDQIARTEDTQVQLDRCPRGTPAIDGQIDELWKGSKPLEISVWGSGTSATEGASAQVRTLWDSSFLYVLVEVQKERPLSKSSPQVYMQDSVEAFIDETDSKLGFYEKGCAQYRVNIDNEASFTDLCDREHFNSKVIQKGNSYIVEMAIPFQVITAKAGKKLGVEFQVNIEVAPGVRNILKWASSSGSSYMDPSTFGDIQLSDPAE